MLYHKRIKKLRLSYKNIFASDTYSLLVYKDCRYLIDIIQRVLGSCYINVALGQFERSVVTMRQLTNVVFSYNQLFQLKSSLSLCLMLLNVKNTVNIFLDQFNL